MLLLHLLVLGLSFFIDSLALYILGEVVTHGVLSFTIAALLYQNSLTPFIAGFIALCFQSFMAYDLFGATCVYTVPLYAFILILNHFLSSRYAVAYVSLGAGLIFHQLFLALFKTFTWPLSNYTFLSIGASIIALYMCLKCFPTAKRGDRF